MESSSGNLHLALERLLGGMCAYQKATLDLLAAVERLHRRQIAFCEPLRQVVATTGAALYPHAADD